MGEPLAYEEWRRQRRCERKKAYGAQANAYRARMRMMRRFNEHFEVYACPYCEKWHVGHAEQLVRGCRA